MRLPIKITRKVFFIGWGLWTLWAVLYAIVLSIGSRLPFLIALMSAIVSYYPLAVFSIFVLIFCRKFRLENHHIVWFVLVHFVVAVVFALFWQTVDYTLGWLLWREAVFYFRPVRDVGAYMVYNGLLIYALLAGIFYTSEMFRRYRENELKAAQLKALTREAEIKALKSQINPHFLFNTLNTIFALIGGDAQKAKATITKLSNLLRYSLSGFHQDFVTLEKELEAVQMYLEIEKARFGDRLQVNFEIDDHLLTHQVLPMLLQPIVENAVKHGIASSKEKGAIEISICKNEDELEIIIQNTGKSRSKPVPNSQRNNGIGLSNLRQRLSRIYGERVQLITQHLPAGGFQAKISIKDAKE
jgi:two-component system LytT family sensor kinase